VLFFSFIAVTWVETVAQTEILTVVVCFFVVKLITYVSVHSNSFSLTWIQWWKINKLHIQRFTIQSTLFIPHAIYTLQYIYMRKYINIGNACGMNNADWIVDVTCLFSTTVLCERWKLTYFCFHGNLILNWKILFSCYSGVDFAYHRFWIYNVDIFNSIQNT